MIDILNALNTLTLPGAVGLLGLSLAFAIIAYAILRG